MGRNRQEGAGSSDSFGEQMLFAALVKIMTHQMEHFKEIHTQLSWLTLPAPLSLHALLLHCLFCLPWGTRRDSKKHTEARSPLSSSRFADGAITPPCADTQVGGVHLQILSVSLDLFTWAMFPINIWGFFGVCLLFNVSIVCVCECLCVCACVCVYISLCSAAELTFPSLLCPRLELTPPSATVQTEIHTDTQTDTHT